MSKTASNQYFELGKKYFSKLFKAKNDEGITRRTPKFVHLRRQLEKTKVPKISMEIKYRNKETGEVTTLEDVESTPTSGFPPDKYEKLYEKASVEVIYLDEILL